MNSTVLWSSLNITQKEVGVELKYGLSPASKWFVKECPATAAPSLTMTAMLLMQNDVQNAAPWHRLNECVLEVGVAFEKAHGVHVWDYAAAHPAYNDLFNKAMAYNANIVMKAIFSNYDGFRGLNSLVDVASGIGATVAEIVKAYPSIKGINYDLPHVIATAPHFPACGRGHVQRCAICRRCIHEGLWFESSASFCIKMSYYCFVFFVLDIFVYSVDKILQWIMHDWGDEDCVRILKQCRKAIPENGKVIIVDAVLNGGQKTLMDPTFGLVFDLLMIALSSGGKERSEDEWKNLLVEAGFPRFNFIAIPALQSVIEAFPC